MQFPISVLTRNSLLSMFSGLSGSVRLTPGACAVCKYMHVMYRYTYIEHIIYTAVGHSRCNSTRTTGRAGSAGDIYTNLTPALDARKMT